MRPDGRDDTLAYRIAERVVCGGGDCDVGNALMNVLTAADIVVMVMIGVALFGGMIGLEVADRRARRRRAASWHGYFHGGGLIRQLIARWKSVPKLTDRSDRA